MTTQLGVQAHFLHCFYSIEPIGFTAISTQKLFEHQADSWMADNSPRTDTSTDLEADAKVDNWVIKFLYPFYLSCVNDNEWDCCPITTTPNGSVVVNSLPHFSCTGLWLSGVQLDDGHHGTTGVSTASDHETTKNGDSKVGLEIFSVPHCVTKCSSVHSGKPLKFAVCM